jgi:hypothetical protein
MSFYAILLLDKIYIKLLHKIIGVIFLFKTCSQKVVWVMVLSILITQSIGLPIGTSVFAQEGNIATAQVSKTVLLDAKVDSWETPMVIGEDGTIYVALNDNDRQNHKVVALDPNGKQKWTYNDIGYIESLVIGTDNTIYAATGIGSSFLIALNQDGSLKWEFEVHKGSPTTPVVGKDGTVYFGEYNGIDSPGPFSQTELYALNPDGSPKWSMKTIGQSRVSPTIGTDGTVFYYTLYEDWDLEEAGQMLYAVSSEGNVISNYDGKFKGIGNNGLVYTFNEKIDFVTGSETFEAVAYTLDGTVKWSHENVSSVFVGQDKTVYIVLESEKQTTSLILALDQDGNQKWGAEVQGEIDYLLSGEDGKLYVESDRLYAFNPDGGQAWEYKIDEGYDVVYDTWGSNNSLVVQDKTIYLKAEKYDEAATDWENSMNYQLIALSVNGTVEWVHDMGKENFGQPIQGKDGDLYLSAKGGKVYLLSHDETNQEPSQITTQEPETQKSEIGITINGQTQVYDQPPMVKDGRTLVPLRGIFETLGANVTWDAKTKTVVATKNETKIVLSLGSSLVYINDQETQIDVPAQVVNARTMVPVRFISEALGAKVSWNSKTKMVIIKQ